MKLSKRIFINSLIIIVVGGLMSTVAGSILISRSVRSEAFSRVSNDLKVAWGVLDRKIDRIVIVSRLLANGFDPSKIINDLPDIMLVFNEQEGHSGWIVKDGRFLEANLSKFYSFISNQLDWSAGSSSGIMKLRYDLLEDLGYSKKLDARSLCDGGYILVLYSACEGEKRTVFCATILNGNDNLIMSLQNLIFGNSYYGGKPFGNVTIFCDDKRVVTTVIGSNNEPAIGTRVSEVVKNRVLGEGKSWLDRAFVVDEWYLSAYEPIVSPGGERIGILYVGVLEKKYVDIRNRSIMVFVSIIIGMIGALALAVFLLSSRIVRPLTNLVKMTDRISSGEFSVDIKPDSGIDEINELTENFSRMARIVEKREKLLTEKNEQLEQTTKDYQELLRFVTHELNNSIGSLLLNANILVDGIVGELKGEQREVAEQLLRDTERFRDMVKNYLNISRLERGKLICRPEPINIKKLVVEPVVKRFERWMKERGFEIRWRWPEEYIVKADRELMDICYSNLIINALKYGKDWIELSIDRNDSGYILGVRNGGEPIPKDKIPLLFQKFSRLVRSSDGAGLGLYLVRKIVEQHGGKVWCSSEREGTGFYMLLPF